MFRRQNGPQRSHTSTQLGIANGDRGAAKERHDGQGGTYMDDPAGYVIQFITDGME